MKKDCQLFKDYIRIVVSLIPEFKKLILVLILISIAYEGTKLVPPYIVKLIVDNLFSKPDSGYLITLVALIFIAFIVINSLEISIIGYISRSAARFQKTINEKIFNKLTLLPMLWHEKQNTGTLISKVTKASGYINDLVWFTSNDIIPICVQTILTGIFLISVEWRIGLIYVLYVPIILWIINRQSSKVQKIREKYHHNYEEATKSLAQVLYNIKTVKDYAKEDREGSIHSNFLKNFVANIYLRNSFDTKAIIVRDVLTTIVRTITMASAVFLVVKGKMSAGDLILVFTLTEKAFSNIYRLGKTYHFMGDSFESLRRVLSIQQADIDMADEGKTEIIKGDIVLDKVYFNYGDGAVLNNINLTFRKNKITALVGPSGSGKSTLVKLLTRQYDPSKGIITVSGINLKDLPLKEVRKHIAFVSQHTEIFDRTIAENIAYGMPNVEKKEIIKAAKAANAHEFIMNFSSGYKTIVGEKGIRLSGGQRQRVAIARAILTDAQVIIFDEATSSLDSESEQAIQKVIFSIKEKTLIIIAHRLSTIQHADAIIVLKDGNIAEIGSHSELINKRGGIYQKMRTLQELGEIRR